MKKSYLKLSIYTLIFASFGFTFLSCNDDNSNQNNSEIKNITFKNTTESKDFVESGTFQGIGVVEGVPHPVILPGESVSFSFSAANQQYLHFATMYGASKDWFFASKDTGLKLFDDKGDAIVGDVSNQVILWDNGSRDDVTGEKENKKIQKLLIDASKLLKLNLTYNKTTSVFTLTITNTSGGTNHETPFSPGVWAVSNFNEKELINKKPFFSENDYSNPEITGIAEIGDNVKLEKKVKKDTGIITNISKAIVVVYEGNENPIYTVNTLDVGKGLKNLSQKGETENLVTYLRILPNVKNVYITQDGIAPKGTQSVKVEIKENQNITFATMFAYSNDWFFSSSTPITNFSKGNIPNIKIFDSGTGINQFPGAGNHQALFGGNSENEKEKIREVKEGEYSTLKSANEYLTVMVN